MDMKKILFFAGAVLAAYFYFKAPSADSIARTMRIDIQNGTIDYKGVKYSAQWSKERVHYLGDVRYIGRAYNQYVPCITNDAIVTTGEFSDPSITGEVQLVNGSLKWARRGWDKYPQGTLVVLHFIPADVLVYNNLKRIKKGQRVEFIGREETDSKIYAFHGGGNVLIHDNHRFFLLEDVRQEDFKKSGVDSR